MKMIDDQQKRSLRKVSFYVSPREAQEMRDNLDHLLENPESHEHFHVYSDDNSREISCSIVTEFKLKNLENYNKIEQQVLAEK